MGIKIVTDSTAYLSKEMMNEYGITFVPLSVAFSDESFKENEITNEYFYEKMKQSAEIPTSSQPATIDIYNLFETHIKDGNDVVAIFLSSKMSGTYSGANLAKNMILEKYPNAKIEIIDSESNCMQMGFCVMAAAKAAKEGKPIIEVALEARKIIATSRFLFVPQTLEYLRKGGRIGGASAIIGGILHIKPILTVENGVATVFDKVRTSKKAIDRMLEKFKSDIDEKGLGDIVVHHIDNEEGASMLAEKVKAITGKNVNIYPIGPIIGLHVGPGTVGIAYYTQS